MQREHQVWRLRVTARPAGGLNTARRITLVAAFGLLVFGATACASAHTARPSDAGPISARSTSSEIQTYQAPLAGALRIVRAFQAPLSAYGAGHRGVDLAARPGEPVRAAGSGRVSFAGSVAGRGVIVIAHAGAISTEYEPVRAVVRIGDSVHAGQSIGLLAGSGCAPASCLHWGAKRNGVYFDPLTLLRPLGPVRLLPLTGQHP